MYAHTHACARAHTHTETETVTRIWKSKTHGMDNASNVSVSVLLLAKGESTSMGRNLSPILLKPQEDELRGSWRDCAPLSPHSRGCARLAASLGVPPPPLGAAREQELVLGREGGGKRYPVLGFLSAANRHCACELGVKHSHVRAVAVHRCKLQYRVQGSTQPCPSCLISSC